jgi:hypothetical protein
MTVLDEKCGDASPHDLKAEAEDLTRNVTIEEGSAPRIRLKHEDRNDADEALKAFENAEGEVIEMTPEEYKALLWKIDLNLMPVRLNLCDSK